MVGKEIVKETFWVGGLGLKGGEMRLKGGKKADMEWEVEEKVFSGMRARLLGFTFGSAGATFLYAECTVNLRFTFAGCCSLVV